MSSNLLLIYSSKNVLVTVFPLNDDILSPAQTFLEASSDSFYKISFYLVSYFFARHHIVPWRHTFYQHSLSGSILVVAVVGVLQLLSVGSSCTLSPRVPNHRPSQHKGIEAQIQIWLQQTSQSFQNQSTENSRGHGRIDFDTMNPTQI